jgi:hypothetical protein
MENWIVLSIKVRDQLNTTAQQNDMLYSWPIRSSHFILLGFFGDHSILCRTSKTISMHENCTSSKDSCTGHFAAAAGPAQNYFVILSQVQTKS